MRRLILGFTGITLLLAACEDESRAPIALDQDDQADTETVEETENDSEENNGDTEDSEDSEDVLDIDEPNEDDILFDVSDDIILEQFVDVTEPFEDQFENDFVQKGMNQENIELRYGPYDFVLVETEGMKVVYGNIAVSYIHGNPAGEGLLGNASLDPVTNIVTEVFYFADSPRADVIEAFGEPDREFASYETSSGQPEMHYYYQNQNGETYTVRAVMNDESGELIVDTLKREHPDGSYSANEDGESIEGTTLETYTEIIEEFMYDYEKYYQDGDDAVFEHVRSGSLAERNITRVDYENYVLYDTVVNYSFSHNNGSATINTNIYFEHDDVGQRQNASMIFTLDENNLEIIDFSAFSVQDY